VLYSQKFGGVRAAAAEGGYTNFTTTATKEEEEGEEEVKEQQLSLIRQSECWNAPLLTKPENCASF
jgi:hypothetical protein